MFVYSFCFTANLIARKDVHIRVSSAILEWKAKLEHWNPFHAKDYTGGEVCDDHEVCSYQTLRDCDPRDLVNWLELDDKRFIAKGVLYFMIKQGMTNQQKPVWEYPLIGLEHLFTFAFRALTTAESRDVDLLLIKFLDQVGDFHDSDFGPSADRAKQFVNEVILLTIHTSFP